MLDICLTVLKGYLLSIPCVLFMNYGRPKSLKNSHLRWYYYTVNDLVSPPLTGVWTPPACCATASWSGFLSGWQNKPSCPASMPAAPTHRCWRAGACSQSARRSLCVVSDAFTWSNNFMHTHTVMPSKLPFICDRFSIYKLTQIVQYFPPWFLDKLISLMMGLLWRFTTCTAFLVTIRVNYWGNISVEMQKNYQTSLIIPDLNNCYTSVLNSPFCCFPRRLPKASNHSAARDPVSPQGHQRDIHLLGRQLQRLAHDLRLEERQWGPERRRDPQPGPSACADRRGRRDRGDGVYDHPAAT